MSDANNKPYTKSNVIGIVGPKGNDKSLLMACTIIQKLIEGEKVWSNMPVHTGKVILARKYSPSGRAIKYAQTEPLDWNLFYQLDKSLVNGTVAIDEIAYQASSRRSSDTRNRLISMVVRQARHRNLDFIYTTRTFYRVDFYVREETDVLIECQDLSYTPWGRQNDLAGGTMACFKYFDISGQTTGRSCYDGFRYNPSKYYMERNFYGKSYHDCYDTREIISLEEACTGIELAFKKRRIGNQDREADGQMLRDKIMDGIAAFRQSGKDVLHSYIFWEYLKDKFGIEGDPRVLGRSLPREVGRLPGPKGFKYDFSGVEL